MPLNFQCKQQYTDKSTQFQGHKQLSVFLSFYIFNVRIISSLIILLFAYIYIYMYIRKTQMTYV